MSSRGSQYASAGRGMRLVESEERKKKKADSCLNFFLVSSVVPPTVDGNPHRFERTDRRTATPTRGGAVGSGQSQDRNACCARSGPVQSDLPEFSFPDAVTADVQVYLTCHGTPACLMLLASSNAGHLYLLQVLVAGDGFCLGYLERGQARLMLGTHLGHQGDLRGALRTRPRYSTTVRFHC